MRERGHYTEHDDLPLVVIAGRPNVGKSTLFNRLVGGTPAIVDSTAGVTRDRRYQICEWGRARFRLVDTGGLDPDAEDGVIQQGIHRQAGRAIDEAAVVLFLIDALEGVTPVDREIAQRLRVSGRPVIHVANKVDSAKHEALAAELYALGAAEVHAVSGAHGRGVGDLLDTIVGMLGEAAMPAQGDNGEPPDDADAVQGDSGDARDDEHGRGDELADPRIRLAFLGKPNVGKSSIVNRLLGEERVLVHDQPGTTVDPIDTHVRLGEREFREFILVDTAGIRRRRSIDRKDAIEVVSVSMAISNIERSDVCALVMDAREGISEQDARIAGLIEKAGRGIVIIFNKSDLLGDGRTREAAKKKLEEEVEDRLPFVSHAPVLFVSAISGERIASLPDVAAAVFDEYSRRIPTSELNRFFASALDKKQPPSAKGNPVKIHYITQTEVRPPLFVLSVNRPEWVHFTYRRFLQNQIRETFGFHGAPVRLVCRGKSGRHRHGTRRDA